MYIYKHLSTVILDEFFTKPIAMHSGIALFMKDACHAAELDQNEEYQKLPIFWNCLQVSSAPMMT